MASPEEIAAHKVALNRYTNEYIVELCRVNGVDATELKDKNAKVRALAELKAMTEPGGFPAGATGGGVLTDPDVVRCLLKEFQAAREDDTRTFLATVQTLVATIPKPPEKKSFIPLNEMAKLADSDDIALWFRTFENLAEKRHKLDKGDWCAALEPFLTGNAQSAYFGVPEALRDDYGQVKQAIFLRYKLTASSYRSKFRSEIKTRSESFLDFAARLEIYFKYWVTPSQDLLSNKEAADIFQKILVDQFISTIRDETSMLKLVEKETESLFEIAKFADTYILERQLVRNVDQKPRQDNNIIKQDNRDNRDKSFMSKRDTSVQAKKPWVKPGGKYTDACFGCGELGHKRYQCPNKSSFGRFPGKSEVESGRRDEVMKQNFVRSEKFGGDVRLIEPHVELSVNGKMVKGLVDSGSAITMVSKKLCDEVGAEVVSSKVSLSWFEGSKVDTLGVTMVTMECAGLALACECVVVETLDSPVLVGRDFIYRSGLTVDFAEGSYWTPHKPIVKWPLLDHCCNVQTLPSDAGESCVDKCKENEVPSSLITPEKREVEIERLKVEFPDVFSTSLGHTDILEHEIELIENVKPIRQKPYNLTPAKQESLKVQIQEMLAKGVIEESKSPWRSPVVMVPKPDNTYRMCVDLRKLNSVTKFDAYHMKEQHRVVGNLSGAKIFSVIDLKSGYWQVGLREQDRELTSFSAGENFPLYQFKVMPFGCKNGSATFQRLMEKILSKAGLLGECAVVKIDDILVYSLSVEEHLVHLRKVLQCLEDAGLIASLTKSRFFLESTKYLGLGVSAEGFSTDPDKVEAIVNYPAPNNRKELDRFLGMMAWFGKFIPQLSDTAEPLFHLRREKVPWSWSTECQDSFECLKEKLCQAPILAHPTVDGEFELHTDASGVGLGAAVYQWQDGKLKTIAYASRTLNVHERRYSTTNREILAVVWGLEKHRHILEGRHVVVFSDHQALTWIFRRSDLPPLLYRWVLRVQEFDFEVKYRPGKQNIVPDALSRDSRFDSMCTIGVLTIDVADVSNKCAASNCSIPDDDSDPSFDHWIQCDHCDKWYHDPCVNVVPEEASSIQFVCPSCKDQVSARHQQKLHDNPAFASVLPSPAELIMMQLQDPELRPIFEYITLEGKCEKPRNNLYKDCSIKSGMLVKGSQIVIPKVLRHHVMFSLHSLPIAGHKGRTSTLKRVLENFVWPGVGKDVQNYVKSCRICQYTKPVYRKPVGPMESIKSNKPWELVAVDLVGPLPTSFSGHKHILVVRDHFSKWVELFPLKRARGKDVAIILVREIFTRFGPCSKLVSDNGPQFVSRFLKAVCAKWGVQQIHCSAYHPQANWVERVNRDLRAMLQSEVFQTGDHRTWDTHLSEFRFAMNTAINRSTGFSPAELSLSRVIQTPIANALRLQDDEETQKSHKQFLVEKIKCDKKRAIETSALMREQASQRKAYYDENRRPVDIKVGDLVLLQTHYQSNAERSFSKKLAPRWEGPYMVVEQASPVTFRVRKSKRLETRHVSQMKHWKS